MPKPSTRPTWSTDTNFSSGPANGQPTKVDPDLEAPQGLVPGATLLAAYINFVLHAICDEWIDWVEDGSDGPEESAHIVETNSDGVAELLGVDIADPNALSNPAQLRKVSGVLTMHSGLDDNLELSATALRPGTDENLNLGDASHRFAEAYATDVRATEVHTGGIYGGYRVTTNAAAVTIAANDRFIGLTSTSVHTTAVTMTATEAGHELTVQMVSWSTGTYTLAVTYGTTTGTVTLNSDNEGCDLVYTGSVWRLKTLLNGATFA